MTKRFLLVGGLLAASILLGGVASAQPLMLKRPSPPAADKAPSPASEGTPGAASDATPGSPAAAPDNASGNTPDDGTDAQTGTKIAPRPLDGQSIVVDSLDAVSADAVGLIGPADGGFGPTLWQGTKWPLVSAMLPRLPETSLSPEIRSLATRLLLSRAVVPDGKPDGASFVALRVERLLALGDLPNALALLRTVPEERRDEKYNRMRVDALFLAGRRSDACKQVAGVVDQYQGIYWRQAQAFCLAIGGNQSRAGLISDLLRESGTDTPQIFYSAMERLNDSDHEAVNVTAIPNGLIASMILAAKIPLPEQVLKNARPSILRAVALSPDVDPDQRLFAAEKALEVGALSGTEADAIYAKFDFTQDELQSPISTAESTWSPRVRALLVRAAAQQPVALGKAEVLRRAWELAREKGGFASLLRATIPLLEKIPADGSMATFAGDAARALFAVGDLKQAMAWYGVVAADSDRVPEMKKAADDLWPLALLADTGETVTWDPARLAAWYAAQRQADPDKALRRAVTYFTMLQATGRDVPVTLWQSLIQGPMVSLEPGLNHAWAEALADAARDGRIGETVMLVASGAAATGDRGFASDAAGFRAIEALRKIGLDDDARRLAVETAIGAGL